MCRVSPNPKPQAASIHKVPLPVIGEIEKGMAYCKWTIYSDFADLYFVISATMQVHSVKFMEFTEIENHDDFYTTEEVYIHTQDQRGAFVMYDVALKDLKKLEKELLLVATQYIGAEKGKVNIVYQLFNIFSGLKSIGPSVNRDHESKNTNKQVAGPELNIHKNDNGNIVEFICVS